MIQGMRRLECELAAANIDFAFGIGRDFTAEFLDALRNWGQAARAHEASNETIRAVRSAELRFRRKQRINTELAEWENAAYARSGMPN